MALHLCTLHSYFHAALPTRVRELPSYLVLFMLPYDLNYDAYRRQQDEIEGTDVPCVHE